jgi:hypothetical protein
MLVHLKYLKEINMQKKHILLELMLVLTLIIYSTTASGIGLAPAEMRVNNAVGSGVIGSIILVNSESEPKHIVLQIQNPSDAPSQQKYLRVICEGCHDTHQKHEIVDGCCPKCGSHDLTFYERAPDEVLNYISLIGKDCHLIKEGSIYVTRDKYLPGEQCSVELLLDLPYKEEYSNKHWEAYVTVTTASDITNPGMGVVAGIQMRLLLDVPTINSSFFSFGEISPMILGAIAGGFVILLCLICIYKKRSAIASALDGYKMRGKPKPVKSKIKHVKEPSFSLRNVTTADIGQPEQKEPTTSILGNVRDAVIAGTIQSDREPLTTFSKHKIEFSDIEAKIDHALKLHEK